MKFLVSFLFGSPGLILADFGISAAVVGAIAAAVSATASVASLVMTATKDEPKMKAPAAVAAPKEDMLAQARAETRRKQTGAKGYNSTILSDITQQYGAAGGGLKEKTGQ